MIVIKRDGQEVNYNRSKIIVAIGKANEEVPEEERVSDVAHSGGNLQRCEGHSRAPRLLDGNRQSIRQRHHLCVAKD